MGYEEGGQSPKRSAQPTGVLLDEIEKAHPDVFNVLLQVLDDGVLTDSSRRRVDFKNTVIIMTSNLGGRQIVSGGRNLGFKQAEGSAQQFAAIKSTVQDELKRAFNPEFLNRIDDVIVFHSLSRENMLDLVGILMGRSRSVLRAQSIHLDISPEAVELLIERDSILARSAAPQRALQRSLEDPLAEFILRGQLIVGGRVGSPVRPRSSSSSPRPRPIRRTHGTGGGARQPPRPAFHPGGGGARVFADGGSADTTTLPEIEVPLPPRCPRPCGWGGFDSGNAAWTPPDLRTFEVRPVTTMPMTDPPGAAQLFALVLFDDSASSAPLAR